MVENVQPETIAGISLLDFAAVLDRPRFFEPGGGARLQDQVIPDFHNKGREPHESHDYLAFPQ